MVALWRYRWQNRVVLVVDQCLDTARLRQQRQWLEQEPAGCAERDLIVAYLAPDATDTTDGRTIPVADAAQLQAALVVPAGQFQVLLIGKDGGVKHRWDAPIAAGDLFGAIDAMPMRQQELQRRSGSGRRTVLPPDT